MSKKSSKGRTFKLMCPTGGREERVFVELNRNGSVRFNDKGQPITMAQAYRLEGKEDEEEEFIDKEPHQDLTRYGIYFQDTNEYDYMQHLKPITGDSGAFFISAPTMGGDDDGESSPLPAEYAEVLTALEEEAYIIKDGQEDLDALFNMGEKATLSEHSSRQSRPIDEQFDHFYSQEYKEEAAVSTSGQDEWLSEDDERWTPSTISAHHHEWVSGNIVEPEVKKGAAALDEIRSAFADITIRLASSESSGESVSEDEKEERALQKSFPQSLALNGKKTALQRHRPVVTPRIIKEEKNDKDHQVKSQSLMAAKSKTEKKHTSLFI